MSANACETLRNICTRCSDNAPYTDDIPIVAAGNDPARENVAAAFTKAQAQTIERQDKHETEEKGKFNTIGV